VAEGVEGVEGLEGVEGVEGVAAAEAAAEAEGLAGVAEGVEGVAAAEAAAEREAARPCLTLFPACCPLLLHGGQCGGLVPPHTRSRVYLSNLRSLCHPLTVYAWCTGT
jgi:hypothetical protein